MQQHNYNIDFLKGILILSVVIGHVLVGPPRENIVRYMIYSVHMPMFIGISGYLVNVFKLKDKGIVELLRKYSTRVIIPWVIAVNVYWIIQNIGDISGGHYTGKEIIGKYISAYYDPWFHLWYIPAFLVYICLTWMFVKGLSKCFDESHTLVGLMLIAILLSAVAFLRPDPTIKLYYYVFFVWGILLRYLLNNVCAKMNKRIQIISGTLAIAFLVLRYFMFFTKLDIAEQISSYYYILNIPLITAVICLCNNVYLPRNPLIESIGRMSLPIYLWHVVNKMISLEIAESGSAEYYIINVVLFLIQLAALYFGGKVRVINHYFLGNNIEVEKNTAV